MKFGVTMFTTDYSISPSELAMAAEERDFESLWLPEHSHIPIPRVSPWPGGGELPKMYYDVIKTVHSYWAFLVIIILTLIVINSIIAKFSGRAFNTKDLRLSLFGLIFSHIQLLIGLILYFTSPWFNQFYQIGMDLLKNAESRLYLIEHPLINIVAIIFITLGWSLHKRQLDSSKKFLRIGMFYGLGLIFLLSRIPWDSWI